MTWAWLKFKQLGIRISVAFGGASESEKAAFAAKWDAACSVCGFKRSNHFMKGHAFGGKK